MRFYIPDDQQLQSKQSGGKDKNGRWWVDIQRVMWFTNLGALLVSDLPLTKRYNPEAYPEYDNYKGIEVSKLTDIPFDYEGIMGVPITLMTKYNPEQFELVGYTARTDPFDLKTKKYTIEDSFNFNDMNGGPVVKTKDGLKLKYKRVLIRNRHPIRL